VGLCTCIIPLKKNQNNNNVRRKKAKPKPRPKKPIGLGNQLIKYRETPYAYTAQLQTGVQLSSTNNNVIRVKGLEHLRSVWFMYGYDSNVDAAIPINPLFWTGTRAANFCDLFCNFKLRKLILHYVPFCSTAVSGQITFGTRWGYGLDDGDTLTTLMSSPGGLLSSIREPFSTNIPLAPLIQNSYYTSPNQGADSIPGYLMWVIYSGLTADTRYGDMLIEYDIEYFNPKLDAHFHHITSRATDDRAFTAAQCTAVGDRRPYVWDNAGALSYDAVGVTVLEDTGNDYSTWKLAKGVFYYLVDMHMVDATQWGIARRYWGIAKTIGGTLLSSLDNAAPHTLTMLTDIWGAVAPWWED
jgi:hypothetical protein